MSNDYRECGEAVRRLFGAVTELERACGLLQLRPLEGREWFELLRQKLVPQLLDDAFLVVAVVGGTNIGKSVIFNHLAGCRASSTSPLASGTKHPVCLVPPGFADRHDLQSIFDGFHVEAWSHSDMALEECERHRLFWRTSPETPENLLVLDTPDIDSDAPVNWQRADAIRRSADVLLAVLTQQKYNDAAVKRFFRQAAAEDKAVIVVFNQCQLPEDEDYWPLWLETFCGETGIHPERVYVAPNDRKAAEENRLPFFERSWPPDGTASEEPRQLTADLSRLHFHQVKLRSLRGALRHVRDPQRGVPEFLDEIVRSSGEFRSAAERLSSESVAKVRDWPPIPNRMLVSEIRRWWKRHQEGWAKRVHGFYDAVGEGIAWPFRFAREQLHGPQTPPLEQYRAHEWEAVLTSVEEVLEKLIWMSESAGPLLRPRFETAVEGKSRASLLEILRAKHAEVDLQSELEDVVLHEMAAFQTDSPELYKFYKQLNNISAAVRPMTSVVLFTLGWGPAGEVVAPFVAEAAAQAVVHVVADFTGGTAAAVAGETAISGAAGRGSGLLQAKFRRMQAAFTARRVSWLADQLKQHLLGDLPEDLQAAASLPSSAAFVTVRNQLAALKIASA